MPQAKHRKRERAVWRSPEKAELKRKQRERAVSSRT